MLRLAWAVAASRPSTNGRSTMTDKLNVLVLWTSIAPGSRPKAA